MHNSQTTNAFSQQRFAHISQNTLSYFRILPTSERSTRRVGAQISVMMNRYSALLWYRGMQPTDRICTLATQITGGRPAMQSNNLTTVR